METTVFLSPSRQTSIIGNGEYGSEARRMNELGNIIEAELERHGVYVEREGNEIETAERIKEANTLNVAAYISLHSNYAPDNISGTLEGTEIYIPSNDAESLRLATKIYSGMEEIRGFIDKGIREKNNYAEIKGPQMPRCLIEVDYHDNYERSCWMIENMTKLGIQIAKGILSYFNIEYKEKYKQKYYRIQLGAFTEKQAAERYAFKLQNAGFPTVIKYY